MWQGVISVLFPKRCIGCEDIIPKSQNFLCDVCSARLPFTEIPLGKENLLYEKINRISETEYASSLLFFKKDNLTQKLIHYLKYKNLPELGEWLAEIWVEKNRNNPALNEIETIIPVPIHPKRLKNRNYNQISLCVKKLARLLDCKYDETILIRTHHLESQTESGKYDRLKRMKGAFQLTNEKPGHYLLVDDVHTTGATLISCTEELLKIKDAKVSVFTLAMTD